MTDENKIARLDSAIKQKQKELDSVLSEKQAVAGNPEQLVLAEKHERLITRQLQALISAKNIVEFKPPAPTDKAELLQPFQRYYAEKAKKVQQVEAAIKNVQAEQFSIGNALQQAAVDCDTEKTIELSEKQTELESRLKHLKDMQKRVNALPVFSDDVLLEEWTAICEKTLPDWNTLALQVEILADEYKQACQNMLTMYNTLKSVRAEIERMAEREGFVPPFFAPIFTIGLDSDRLVLNKGDYIQLADLAKPISGRPL